MPLFLAIVISGVLGIGVGFEHGPFTGAAIGYLVFMVHCHAWELE